MSARDHMLASVRQHLGRSGRPSALPPPPPVPLLGRVDIELPARIEQFAERLESLAGHCHHESPGDALTAIVARYGVDTIATSDAAVVQQLRADARFAALDWLPPDAPQDALFGADLGITTAQWGISETGTLVLDSASEQNRLASLLPPVHLALLPRSHLLANLGELLKTVGQPLPTALTLITGPSRTADIEMQLVLGVHGPRELHVVLV